MPSGAICRQLGFTIRPHEARAKIAAVESIREFWGSLEVKFNAGHADFGGGSGSGWYPVDAKDGSITLVTSVRHVKQIGLHAQEIGMSAVPQEVRKSMTEVAMEKMAESDPAKWAEDGIGGWGFNVV